MIQAEIEIKVKARYLTEQSDPAKKRYAFAYTVNIENNSNVAIKLLSRHWLITDDNDKTAEVKGKGVVGLHPLIRPGQKFHYTSSAVLETEFGTMQGSYEMISAEGVRFKTPIPPFLLARPNTVH